MSTAIQIAGSVDIERVLMQGDLAKLTSDQRLSYYNGVCESLGLNPLTRPFEYITLNGKLTLYARKDATEQLRKKHGVSIRITRAEQVGGIFVVVAEATDAKGRTDSATGAVATENLRGDALANALMKAETKSKRRVTLSICGLGMLDETEVESIPEARHEKPVEQVKEAIAAPVEEVDADLGNYVVPFGKKLYGQRLKDIAAEDLSAYVAWLNNESIKSGKPISGKAEEFIQAVNAFRMQCEETELGKIPF